jgi:hypothetical protein
LFAWWFAERFFGMSLDQSVDIRRLALFRLWQENQPFDACSDQLLDMPSGEFISAVVFS